MRDNSIQRSHRFALAPDRSMIELMYSHPFNPAADFVKASQLANSGTVKDIQEYLDKIGIVSYTNESGRYGFTATDIHGLDGDVIFFYLTRFYGPPVKGDLETKYIIKRYKRLATNDVTKGLARQIENNFEAFREYQNEFDKFFNHLNSFPEYPIEQNFGTHNRRRLLNDFFSYLKLLRAPNNLPVLTLNSVSQLSVKDRDRIYNFLKNYTDDILDNFIGKIDDLNNNTNRNSYLYSITRHLLSNRVFLLTSQEAELCINKQSTGLDNFADLGYGFLGQGSIIGGFRCYDVITDLFENFEGNTSEDGTIAFLDPSSRELRNFTTDDLKQFREAIAAERQGMAAHDEILARFDRYIRQSELQSSADYMGIKAFVNFANQSDANKQLVKNIFLNFFYMGMYMRQWRGPGNPYPIASNQTGESVSGLGRTQDFVQQNVDSTRDVFMQYFEQLPVPLQEAFWQFKLYSKQNLSSEIVDKGHSLRKMWNDVILRGTYCVRMASGPWSFTGAHYLKQILNENIPGFTLENGVPHII